MLTDIKEVKVGIVGLGTVGGGAATVLAENADVITARALFRSRLPRWLISISWEPERNWIN